MLYHGNERKRFVTLALILALALLIILPMETHATSFTWNSWSSSSNQGTAIDSMNASTTNGWIVFYGANNLYVNSSGLQPNGKSISVVLPPNPPNYTYAIEKNVNVNLNNAANFYFWVYVANVSKLAPPGSTGVSLQLTTDANWNNYWGCSC